MEVLIRGTGPTAKRCQVMEHTAMGAIVLLGSAEMNLGCLERKEVDILRVRLWWVVK